MKKPSMIALVLLFLLAPQWVMAEMVIQPFYTDTNTITADLSISGGTATCKGSVKPLANSSSVTITVTLQKKVDGVWKKFASWSDSGKGLSGASVSEPKALDKGYDYRVYVSGVVKDASGAVLERPTKYSTVKTY